LTPTLRCAVIGAGIAGLACARALRDAGASVAVFERGPAPGGRAATRVDHGGAYDHGAQYFTATDERFIAEVRRWQSAGAARRWFGRIGSFADGALVDKTASAERHVGTPGMGALAARLADGLEVRCSAAIEAIHLGPDGWHLDRAAQAPFDTVLAALPSPLAADLLEGLTPLVDLARSVTWDPCWAVTMALAQETGAGFDGAFINDDPILGWAALDSAKPERGRRAGIAERWVLHARPQWSLRYADIEPQDACRWLIRSFSARLRTSLNPVAMHAELWRHATPVNPLPQRCLWDPERRIGMAGDWLGGPRIEGAFLSGLALAEAVLRR
jgi:predicted NAD/FAD-dependent oxidoreductase